MAGEIVFARSVQAVSSALGEVLRTYRLTRTYSRAELVAVMDRAREAQAHAAPQARGRLIRANLEELAETQRLIDSQRLTGHALAYAMDQLHLLHVDLKRNYEAFGRG